MLSSSKLSTKADTSTLSTPISKSSMTSKLEPVAGGVSTKISAPLPPIIKSLPLPAEIRSLPAPPSKKSSPLPPSKTSSMSIGAGMTGVGGVGVGVGVGVGAPPSALTPPRITKPVI